MGKLTAARVRQVIESPGRYSDGNGLLLFVRAPGQASWVGRFQHNGKRRDYGLGSAKLYSLAEARQRAYDVRRALADGRDPRTLWEPPAPLLRPFKEAALAFLDAMSDDAAISEKKRKQQEAQLRAYAFPALGKLQVQSIDADRIAACLRPIWQTKPETARKVRSLIIRTLRYARPDGALFVGTLGPAIADRLPAQPRRTNFDALPYKELPALMRKLAAKGGMGALALRATILCASRSGEIRGARWEEVDLDKAVWTIPAERMKAGKAHRVPLSPQALALFKEARAIRRAGTDLVFPNGNGGKLSDMTLTKVLRDMGLAWTVHGLRSTFRDWAAEQTEFPGEVAEAALAHTVSNAVEAAYRRTDFFDKRRELMQAWGRFAMDEERSGQAE